MNNVLDHLLDLINTESPSNLGDVVNEETGEKVSYPEFFKGFGYADDEAVYIRNYYDDENDKKEYSREFKETHGRNPKQNESYNPLKVKFNNSAKTVNDFPKLCQDKLFVINSNGYGIWFVVNGSGQSDKAILEKHGKCKAWFVEWDDISFEEMIKKLKSFSLVPSVIIITKKSMHVYWLSVDGDIGMFRTIQGKLISIFNSDKTIVNESRVMRLPGFYHNKDKNNRKKCRLLKFDPEIKYTQKEMLAAISESERVTAIIPNNADRRRDGDNINNKAVSSDADYEITDKAQKSIDFVEKWLEKNNISYEADFYTVKATDTKPQRETRRFSLQDENDIPWKDDYQTPWCAGDTVILVALNGNDAGQIGLSGRHSHDKEHSWKDFRLHYEPGAYDSKSENSAVVEPKQFDIKLMQGRKLQKLNLPPIVYPVENIIPEGYTVGSAPFKFGKSWLALEMCLAIADGSDFLGQRTQKGSTIYMALEDCDKFAQERLNMVLDGREAPEGFYYIYEKVPRLDDGFIDYLNQLYTMVPDIRLIVIDVLALIEYESQRKESAYKCDYRTGTALKTWADEHGTSILAITHTTKLIHPNDVFMNTSGTNGVTGSADAILTIAKESRTDKEGILAITGRRVREKYFRVRLKDGYLWETDGEVDPQTMQTDTAMQEREERHKEYKTSDIREAVVKLVHLGVVAELSSRDIIDKAREQEIYLLSTPAEVGLFIHKFQNYFITEDGIKVYIHKRGTGSNLYRFEAYEPIEEPEMNPFDDS